MLANTLRLPAQFPERPYDPFSLVQEAQRGDLEAFNRLVLNYQTRVYNLAYHLLGEQTAAEDATQTAFLNAFANLKSFRGGSFINWLLRIVSNLCYDELRRFSRHPQIQIDPQDEGEEQPVNLNVIPEDAPTPDQVMSQVELSQVVHAGLQRLPAEYRLVVALVDLQGYSYEEAAQILKKPLGTIKSRLTRGRLKLRGLLKGYVEA